MESDENGDHASPKADSVSTSTHMETRRTTKRASIAEPQESNDLLWAIGLGTSFDTPDRHGLTPLMIACRDNKLDVVQYLVDRGSNINAVDERGFSPIFYSVREGNHLITEYLLVQGANCLVTLNGGFNLLMYAAMNGDCQHIQILQRYILIDAVDEDGLSPLMYTAIYKCTEAMNLLLSMNANPYLVSKEGKTVTYLCIEQGYEDGLRLLVQHHVSLDVLGTITSHSSLYSACFMKYRNIARFLLQEDTNMAGFLDDLCCTSDRIAQSIVEVGLQELYLTMSKERKVYIQTTFLDGCRKYGEYLLSYVTSPSHVRFPCSQIADIFIYCIKISKMLCDRSQQLHVCDSIWKHIEQTFNKLHYLCTHCTNPDQIVRPSFLTRVLFTFLEGYCLCYSSINSSKEEEEKKINIIRCQALIFNDQTLVHFLLKNKTLLLLMNKNDPTVYHRLTYYPLAMTYLTTIQS